MTSQRERILARVRNAMALRDRSVHPGPLAADDSIAGGAARPRPHDRTGPARGACAANAARFMEQFRANGGEAIRFESIPAARAWLDGFAADFDGAATSPLVPQQLVPSIPSRPPESAPLGISLAAGAAAASGTLLLDSREGRRLQLLPPVHLVWIRERDIEDTLAAALASVRGPAGDAPLPAAIGLHSAPSKSADIGRILVVGVHGPGRVIAAVIAAEEDASVQASPPPARPAD